MLATIQWCNTQIFEVNSYLNNERYIEIIDIHTASLRLFYISNSLFISKVINLTNKEMVILKGFRFKPEKDRNMISNVGTIWDKETKNKIPGWSSHVYSKSSQIHYFTIIIWQQELWTKNLCANGKGKHLEENSDCRFSVNSNFLTYYHETEWLFLLHFCVWQLRYYLSVSNCHRGWRALIPYVLLFKYHNRHSHTIIYKSKGY